jgi:hypothetical protein
MGPCGRRSPARYFPGVLAAFLAGALCAPSAARAGCEHRPFLPDGRAEALPQGATTDSTKPAAPCNGPACSRGPSQAPGVPPAPAPRKLKPAWAFLAELFPDEAGPGGRLDPSPSPSPVRRATSIFHPPRPAPVAPSL